MFYCLREEERFLKSDRQIVIIHHSLQATYARSSIYKIKNITLLKKGILNEIRFIQI